jgi:hypothetical protein
VSADEDETDGVAADDTALAAGCARAFTYTVPPAVTPTTATTASAVYVRGRRGDLRARRRAALEDSMAPMLGPSAVRAVRRTLELCQRTLRNP